MTLVTRLTPTNSTTGLDGTVILAADIAQIYDQVDAQAHSTTNPTIKPNAIIDEVVTARGSLASLNARMSVSLAADGTLAVSFANVSGGLRVGFAGTTSADRIDLGDATFFLDYAAGGAGVPGLQFDTNDLVKYTRSTNLFEVVIGAASVFSVDASLVLAPSALAIGSNRSTTGTFRTASAATVKSRNNANSADLEMLALGSAADLLTLGSGATGVAAGSIFNGKGAVPVASQAAMPVPIGNLYHVTGTTNITSLTATGLRAGTVVTLIFDDVLTFTDGSNLVLAGNFVTTANDTITLVYDGTNWYEICRSVN